MNNNPLLKETYRQCLFRSHGVQGTFSWTEGCREGEGNKEQEHEMQHTYEKILSFSSGVCICTKQNHMSSRQL